MKIEIEANDINRLSHTAMASFFKEQAERFESTTYKGVEFDEIQDGRMSFWTEGYLNAVIIYNWFTAKGYRCAILGDTAEDYDYAVWVDRDCGEYFDMILNANDIEWINQENNNERIK